MNGTGKSTFAKLAVGILLPQLGSISYKNTPLSLVRIGYLQQRLHLSYSMPLTVKDFVMMGCIRKHSLFFSKEDNERALQAISQCGLENKVLSPLKHLSGGQTQRALIARLLVTEPEVIVLDEPFEGLDVRASQVLLDQLHILKSKITILMISHNSEMIAQLADEIFCISNDEKHHNYLEYFSKHNSIPVEHICTRHKLKQDH